MNEIYASLGVASWIIGVQGAGFLALAVYAGVTELRTMMELRDMAEGPTRQRIPAMLRVRHTLRAVTPAGRIVGAM